MQRIFSDLKARKQDISTKAFLSLLLNDKKLLEQQENTILAFAKETEQRPDSCLEMDRICLNDPYKSFMKYLEKHVIKFSHIIKKEKGIITNTIYFFFKKKVIQLYIFIRNHIYLQLYLLGGI